RFLTRGSRVILIHGFYSQKQHTIYYSHNPPSEVCMRRAVFRSLLFVFSFDLSAQQQLASLHPQTALVWQRTSPTAQKPDGPVLYQIIFRSSAIPGNVPMISPQ